MAHFKTDTRIKPINSFPNTISSTGKFEQFVSSLENLSGNEYVSASQVDTSIISRLFIKNMVSRRCIIVLKAILENLGFGCISIEIGTAEVWGKITDEKKKKLSMLLLKSGMELISNKRDLLVERIRIAVTEMIFYNEELPSVKMSCYLSEKLKHNYTYLANVFSEVSGISIQQFIIDVKMERIKSMLCENITLSEIAFKLQYSSVAYLSRQFKKNVGLMPSHFKKAMLTGREKIE